MQPPAGWKLIDRQSLVDGTLADGVPPSLVGSVAEEVTKALDSGVLVAFYRFDQPTQYIPNVFLSRLEAQPDADIAEQAASTVTHLQSQGFVNVTATIGSSSAGSVVGVRYTVPEARTGSQGDLFASSHVVFGNNATWTVTGLTAENPEAIEQVVASLAGSILER